MYIRKSTTEDLPAMQELYESARQFMKEQGNPTQWGDSYPTESMLKDDISKGISYVCAETEDTDKSEERILATFVYYYGQRDINYEYIEDGAWSDEEPYGVVHRITTRTGTRGVGKYCLDWAYEQCEHLRIDTHHNNIPMQNLIRKCGFEYCGVVYMKDDDGSPRDAFIRR